MYFTVDDSALFGVFPAGFVFGLPSSIHGHYFQVYPDARYYGNEANLIDLTVEKIYKKVFYRIFKNVSTL